MPTKPRGVVVVSVEAAVIELVSVVKVFMDE